MGSGKTEQTIDYLKANPSLSILVITLIAALSNGVYTRIKDACIPIEHYDINHRRLNNKNMSTKQYYCSFHKLFYTQIFYNWYCHNIDKQNFRGAGCRSTKLI